MKIKCILCKNMKEHTKFGIAPESNKRKAHCRACGQKMHSAVVNKNSVGLGYLGRLNNRKKQITKVSIPTKDVIIEFNPKPKNILQQIRAQPLKVTYEA